MRSERSNFVRNHSSVILLVSLVTLALLNGLISEQPGRHDVLALALLATLAAGTLEAASSKRLTLIAAGLAAVTSTVVIVARWFHVESAARVQWILIFIFFAFCATRLLKKVLRPGFVTAGKLYDAVSVYLLLGLTWASLYNWTEQRVPGSFRLTSESSPHPITPEIFLYFSFSTLTTVGYGDVIAVRSLSRMLVSLEAIAGVLYVAILIARLAGSYGRRKRSDAPSPTDEL
jgi:ion channel